MSNDEKPKKPVILTGIKPDTESEQPQQRIGVFNPDFKPTCGHDHSDGSSCGGHHDHKHAPFINISTPANYNHQPTSSNKGVLKAIFSKVSGETGAFLDKHRKKLLLSTTAACAIAETLVTKNVPVFSLPFLAAGAVLSHDASEDVMEQIGKLKDSQGLSAGVVGTAVGFGHTLAEGAFSLMASFNETTDMAVASVMGSQPSHILLMAGGAAVIGTLGAGKSSAWKLHAGAMGILTGAFGAQVATGEFYPVAGAAMMAGGGYYLYRRFKDGQGCAIHGSACSGHHHDHHAHEHDEQQKVTIKQRMTDPHLLGLGSSVITLTTAAHLMAHEFLDLSQQLGVSETTMGTTIAAISLAAPELILTWKAAYKGERDMAWGTVVGCSTATVGLVGGGLALSGTPIPEMLNPATTEGLIHMIGFGGSTAAVLLATHPSINNIDGKLKKGVGAAFLASYLGYVSAVGFVKDDNDPEAVNASKIIEIPQSCIEQDNDEFMITIFENDLETELLEL